MTDLAILGVLTAMIVVDVVLSVAGYGGRLMASLGVLPPLLLALYLAAVNVHRRRKMLIAQPTRER
jgi:hypothetical protein